MASTTLQPQLKHQQGRPAEIMTMRQRFIPFLATAACLALAGCGGSAQQEYKYRIAVIPKGLTHEFWQSIERGSKRAGDELTQDGIPTQIIWDGPLKENDTLEQISIIDRNIAKGVSGIVLAPQHSKTMVPPVERAVKQGIPVLIIDSGLENQNIIAQYVATNNYHGGELAAQHLLKALADQGKPAPRLILFRYQVGSESTDQREKGFEDTVNRAIEEQQKEGKPTITWLSKDKFAGATKDTARREAEPLLNNMRDRGIDGIFAPNESSASGMVDALRSLGLNQQVRLVGFDSSAPLLQALRHGDIDALILQDPYRMAYLGVWNLVQHLEGKQIGPKVVSTGEHVITKSNMDDTNTQELFDAELQARRQIESTK
jgi:ribose transport system substrate-binding protein